MSYIKSPFSFHFQYNSGNTSRNYLVNLATGEMLELDQAHLKVWLVIKKVEALRSKIVEKKSLEETKPYLRFLKKLEAFQLISPNKEKVMSFLFDKFPHRSRAILWTEHRNQIVVFYFDSLSKKVKSKKLSKLASNIFLNSDGNSTFEAILKKLKLKNSRALDILKILQTELCSPDLQALKFLVSNSEPSNFAQNYVLYQRYGNFSLSKKVEANKLTKHQISGGHTDLGFFHRNQTLSAWRHFNEVEISFSHAFREKNDIFSNLSYGGAFYEAVRTHQFRKRFSRVLEVGGGTGILAKEFLKCSFGEPAVSMNIQEYTLCDISPRFLKSQKMHLKNMGNRAKFLQADAQTANLGGKFDLIICNEVIADFLTVKINPLSKKDKKVHDPFVSESLKWLRMLDPLSFLKQKEVFYFNLGAIRFLENMYRHMEPFGTLLVSEYGSFGKLPTPTLHLNHDEYSIYWPHLIAAAKFIGYRSVDMIDLQTFLDVNSTARVFSGPLDVLTDIFSKLGKKLEKRVYDENEILSLLSWAKKNKKFNLKGVHCEPFKRGIYWGPNIKNFQVLVLQK